MHQCFAILVSPSKLLQVSFALFESFDLGVYSPSFSKF
jgi:hypothetical protein